MKTALIAYKRVDGGMPLNILNKLCAELNNYGFNVDTVEVLDNNDDIGFKRRLCSLKDTADNLIIVNSDSLCFDMKSIIAEEFETTTVENENARKFVDEMSKATGQKYSDKYAELPLSSTLIPNALGVFQGYMIDDDSITLAVLAGGEEECLNMCAKYLIPFFENKYGIKRKKVILKLMCDRHKIDKAIEDAKKTYDEDFDVFISEEFGDVKLQMCFDEKSNVKVNDVIRSVVGALKEDVYADFDTTPAQRLFDIIKLKNLKLSTAESFTAGQVASEFIKNAGASAYFDEGIISYSNDSKIDRLKVVDSDLKKEGAVSSVVAYQMALGLLRKGSCDVAISTTGIAGPKSDDTNKPVGLCYISVGMKSGIHTYKFNFSGTREEVTKKAVNSAHFLAIKILKRI